MLILAFDTATSAITAAVHDGAVLLAERHIIDTRRHAEALAPTIAAVLADAQAELRDITHIGVGIGPGPFTGLRIGVVTAVTFGHALSVPVLGICSLDAIAHAAAAGVTAEFLVASDARRKEIYWARYTSIAGRAERLSPPSVGRPMALDARDQALPCAGRGPLLYPEFLPHPIGPQDVSAACVAELTVREVRAGRHPEPAPLYLRRPDAQEPGAPRPTLVAGTGS